MTEINKRVIPRVPAEERELLYEGITNRDSIPKPPDWFIRWIFKLMGR